MKQRPMCEFAVKKQEENKKTLKDEVILTSTDYFRGGGGDSGVLIMAIYNIIYTYVQGR